MDGSVFDGAAWIAGGYSTFSFICLYLLGRYIKKYGDTINVGRYFRICSLSKGNLLLLFSSIVFLLTFLAYTVTYLGIPIEGRLFTYTNPLVILESKVSHPLKHCLFSFTFVCRPPYSLTFNT